MRKKGYVWTPQEIELAQSLAKQRAPKEMYVKLLGRAKSTCHSKLYRVQFPLGIAQHVAERITIPPQVIEDRNRRLMARKSLTAQLMGDPPIPMNGRNSNG